MKEQEWKPWTASQVVFHANLIALERCCAGVRGVCWKAGATSESVVVLQGISGNFSASHLETTPLPLAPNVHLFPIFNQNCKFI